MLERIEAGFRGFISALQTAKLYGTQHRNFTKALDAAFEGFQAAFQEKAELVFGIIGEELAFEKEILFDLSRNLKSMILYLKKRGIERMVFYRPMSKEELRIFLEYVNADKELGARKPDEYLASAGVRNIIAGKLGVTDGRGGQGGSGGGGGQGSANYGSLYAGSMGACQLAMDAVLTAGKVNVAQLRTDMANIFDGLLTCHQELLKLTVLKRYDMNTFTHILNVSILSMFFAFKSGLPKDEILEIGVAAVFHDIGKVYIARSLVKKPDRLTDEEFETIKGHTLFGAEVLLTYIDEMGMLPVLVAFEHHLKSDLKGYPKVAFPRQPHLASRMVAVCDIYDALFSRRSYKAGLAPNVIYDIMMKEKLKMYCPEMVDHYFRLIGVWPVGCIVVLNDGRTAIVRDANEADIFFPKIEIVTPEGCGETIDLSKTKPAFSIEKMLDPTAEGSPFVPFI